MPQQCPRCDSTNFRNNGKTKKGTIRYICKDCRKSWSNNPMVRPPLGLVAMTNAEKQKAYRERKKAQNSICAIATLKHRLITISS